MVEKHGIDALAERYDILRARAEAMAKQLEFLKALLILESRGVAGYHRNGGEALWQEFDEFLEPCAADAYRADFPAQKEGK